MIATTFARWKECITFKQPTAPGTFVVQAHTKEPGAKKSGISPWLRKLRHRQEFIKAAISGKNSIGLID